MEEKIIIWDIITDLSTKAEFYSLKNLDLLLQMIDGHLEVSEDEITHYAFCTIEECTETITALCNYIAKLQKIDVIKN